MGVAAHLTKGEYVLSPQAVAGMGLLVALTSAEDKKAQVSANLARKATQAISDELAVSLDLLWEQANAEALSFLTIVIKNNPKKAKSAILARPDIREALRYPYEQAARQSEELIREAWKASEVDTVQKVKAELKLLGEAWQGYETDTALLDAVVADLHKNARAMRGRYTQALNQPNEGLAKRLKVITDDVKRRAVYSGSTAVWGVATQVRDSAFAKTGLNKMWLAVLDDRTCSHCRGLHKKVVGPGEQFPAQIEGAPQLKVYRNVLFGPPRHPNCRCVIVGTKKTKN